MNTFFWIYGTCRDRIARKHRFKGNVQFVLWKAGEHGHKKDFWINFYPDKWHEFVADKTHLAQILQSIYKKNEK